MVLLTLPNHLVLPLGRHLSTDQLALLGLEISQSYIGLIGFPSSLTCYLLVLAHMLLELMLCGFSPHELIHASGIGFLPEIPSVLACVEHL